MTRYALALLLLPGMASAQPCAPHGTVTERLADRYQESLQAIGLGANSHVVEVYASKAGTWTIIMTSPAGIACMMAAGEAYEAVNEAYPTPGEDG